MIISTGLRNRLAPMSRAALARMLAETIGHEGFSYPYEVFDPKTGLWTRGRALNLVPTEGLTLALNVLLHATVGPASWYFAPFSGEYTPVAGITAATFPAAATELTTYEEATRVEVLEAAASAGAITSAPAVFTSNAAGTIKGFALLSTPTKGSTAGFIASIARTASPIDFPSGAIVRTSLLGSAANPS